MLWGNTKSFKKNYTIVYRIDEERKVETLNQYIKFEGSSRSVSGTDIPFYIV